MSRVKSDRSLAIGHQYSSLGTQPILCGSIPGLVPKQLRFCRNYVEIMPSVAEGVKIGIQECQHQFRGRRWNCTTVNDSLAIFGPVLDKATHTLPKELTLLLRLARPNAEQTPIDLASEVQDDLRNTFHEDYPGGDLSG
ncbi:hypothetical protein lerEdw1_005985 [Lerista edwardsae]|nr:hypothetical protein lerEdw1_005985 [Lerista edwardsae]